MKPRKIQLMGIVNLTDNSFFSASRRNGAAAVAAAWKLAEEGADVIDLGASSSRPGAEPVPEAEEWKRLAPVLQELAGSGLRLSLDTTSSEVIRRAFDLYGPLMVNDISAGAADPQMLPTAARLGLPYIAMHMRGTPATMAALTDYPEGIVQAVRQYFADFARKAEAAGLQEWILDPGYGFAKTLAQNWELLSRQHELKALGRPLLAGLSRKSMLYKPLGITPEDALPATMTANFIALQQGADWLRVHDIPAARQTVALYRLWEAGLTGASATGLNPDLH